MALAGNLPPGAMVWRSTMQDAAWTDAEHLLAQIVDALHAANWQRAGDSKAKQPKPVPRPADVRADSEKKTKMLDRAQRFKERNKIE